MANNAISAQEHTIGRLISDPLRALPSFHTASAVQRPRRKLHGPLRFLLDDHGAFCDKGAMADVAPRTRSATKLHDLSLLSMARLNRASSRGRYWTASGQACVAILELPGIKRCDQVTATGIGVVELQAVEQRATPPSTVYKRI